MSGLAEALAAAPVVGIVRLPPDADPVTPMAVTADAGLRVLEVTLTTPVALDALGRFRARAGVDVVVGAGSVREVADVRRAHDAGAQFIVTPTTVPAVIAAAVERGLQLVCGGLTPSELDNARALGAHYQKLFPASAVGPSYVREVRAPMPDLRLIPTGGVTIDQVPAYRAAGATAVGVGSALVDPAVVAAGDWQTLTKRTIELLQAWDQ